MQAYPKFTKDSYIRLILQTLHYQILLIVYSLLSTFIVVHLLSILIVNPLLSTLYCWLVLSTLLLSTLIIDSLLSTLIADYYFWLFYNRTFYYRLFYYRPFLLSTLYCQLFIVDSYCRLLLSILYIVDSLLHVDTYCWLFIV